MIIKIQVVPSEGELGAPKLALAIPYQITSLKGLVQTSVRLVGRCPVPSLDSLTL